MMVEKKVKVKADGNITKPKKSERQMLREALSELINNGYKINEAAGICGLKRSEAQRILEYND